MATKRIASPVPRTAPSEKKNDTKENVTQEPSVFGKGYAEARCPTGVVWEKPEVPLQDGKKQGNVTRRKTDYYWIALIFLGFTLMAELAWPGKHHMASSEPENLVHLVNLPFGFQDPLGRDYWKVFVCYFFQAALAIPVFTFLIYLTMYVVDKEKTYTPSFWRQVPGICANLSFFLPLADTGCTLLCCRGWGKMYAKEAPYNAGDHALLYHVRDIMLWIMAFELTWYTQHRAMHDSKFLWKLGHEYHHQWRKPEHMIGITNFAFDHIVELWVTMSSSYIPMLLFPIHYWSFRIIGFTYMILAVLVHWDAFPVRYHLNHHYCVIKNYGSHVLFWDWLFGTYQPGSYFPATFDDLYPSFKPSCNARGSGK